MFCRNCGKQLLPNAVACISCGLNPHYGRANCPACGVRTKGEQIICTSCGSSLKSRKGLPTGLYIVVLILSFIMPIVGFIYGGIQIKNAPKGSQKRSQAWHFVIAGAVAVVLYFIGSD